MKTIYIALREGQKWTFAFKANNYNLANQALKRLQLKYKNLQFTLISSSKHVDCKSVVDVLRPT